ncbi:MAG TPA: bifunctional 4-hydroxy-2-oxoglutarate aldolase/2-dehydro-3-deoxy-phosphogluconate aldolase [Candidatus Acidoferrum sp.]|nr:bifunctional 4-hydroxy-2-oxoglutarate aldolase/2-dehydro-3-deoxy-phosphogluconate aldolase [Candidatus Acidoferrum sp.]
MSDTDARAEPARPALPDAIAAGGIVAIGRRLPVGAEASIATALLSGGVRAFEITLDGSGALDAIAGLSGRFAPDELLVGAGTVMDIASAEAAVAAGARFLVMPHLDTAIVAWAAARGIPVLPGAFTPTEIVAAWRAGAAAVKLFPASAFGPSFVREVRGPLPYIPLVPTGGVAADTAGAFIAAGAVAVGIGSWLTGSGDPALVEARARESVAAIAAARPRAHEAPSR